MSWRRLFLIVSLVVYRTQGIELSFELKDNAKECFYEEIVKSTPSSLEYQVVSGGKYDVDVTLHDPSSLLIYRRVKQENDNHLFTARTSGVYKLCFSNEFSTFSHKLVFFRLQIGTGKELPLGQGKALTALEKTTQEIHARLVNITDYQRHHRLRESQGRKRAEDLNDRVKWWSLAATITVVLVTVGQVMALKNFFPERTYSGVNAV